MKPINKCSERTSKSSEQNFGVLIEEANKNISFVQDDSCYGNLLLSYQLCKRIDEICSVKIALFVLARQNFVEPRKSGGSDRVLVKIRLFQMGRKKKRSYRIVVMDARRKRNGQYLEKVGLYNPQDQRNNPNFSLDMERVHYWLSQGAQPTDIVKSFIRKLDGTHSGLEEKQEVDESLSLEDSKTTS